MAQRCHVMVPEFRLLFVCKVLLVVGMEVPFHLPHDMLRFMVIFNFKVGRRFGYLVRMAAMRAEFPFLEAVNVRKCPASSRTTDDEVHTY